VICATGRDRQPEPSGGLHRSHDIFRSLDREVGECLHHKQPLLQSLAAFIGIFGIIACDVVQAMLDDFLLEVGFLLRPGSEGCAVAYTVRESSPVSSLRYLSMVMLLIGLFRLRPGNTNSSLTRLS
jgi:hypothetical protein